MERFNGMEVAQLSKKLSRAGSRDEPGATEQAVF
jgi:hypothetical protein